MRLSLLICVSLLPQTALADCVYTGAKRAYLECIYNEALTNTYALVDQAAALVGLDTRLSSAETDVGALEAGLMSTQSDLTALAGSVTTLEGTTAALGTTLTALDTEVGTLSGDITDLQTATTDLRADVDALQVGGGGGGGGVGSVVQTVVATSTTTSTLNTTTFTEPNSSYRISITPQYANSLILVEYNFSMNAFSAANTIFHMQLVRGPGSTNTPVGVGPANGSRNRTSFVGRPGNGYDTNDVNQIHLRAVDSGFTAGVPVTYGFLYRRETGGTATAYFNYSAVDTSSYGFSGVMTITAMEIRQ
jgi:hypothetical protein